MKWSSALSLARDPVAASKSAAEACADELGPDGPDLALVFFTPEFAAAAGRVGETLRETLAPRHVIGCTAGGVIGGGREVEQGPALALTAACLPGIEVTPFHLIADQVPDADASPNAWSEALGADAADDPHFLVLADPFTFPAPHLLAGLDYAFRRGVKLGGLASGTRGPGQSALLLDEDVHRRGMVGVSLAGDLRIETIVAQGCRPVGPTLRVTRSRGNILMGLDDRPALETVHEVLAGLDEQDRRLARNSLHLGLQMDPLSGEPRRGDFLIRNLAGIDPGSGAILIGDELRDGQSVRLHVRDADSSRQDLEFLLDRFAQEPRDRQPRGALLFSCLGRGRHLYGEPDHDSRLLRAKLGRLPLGGFFCNGEIGPVGGSTHLHGFTSSFGLFSGA